MAEEKKSRTARRWTLAFLVLMLLALPAAADIPAPGGRAVLVVDGQDPWRPGYVAFMSALRPALQSAITTPVAIYAENLDLGRFQSPEHRAALGRWYAAKYEGQRLDAVVVIGSDVLELLQEWRTAYLSDVPLVFVARTPSIAGKGRPAGATGITFDLDVLGSARAALALRPDTRRVALVGGREPPLLRIAAELRDAFGDRIEWIDLTGLGMAEIRRRVAALPKHTIIFYTALSRDGAGQTWVPREALVAFATHANQPIFSLFGPYIGHGIVGGSLYRIELLVPELARVLAQLFEGQPPASIPVRSVTPSVLQFDWTQLQRWGLDERRLPPGSQILYRPPSLWSQHRKTVVVTLGVLVLQGVAIGGLLLERGRRRRAETNLRRLSGRLLTAQEDERRRIARELHDDVGQHLALLAIEADQLRAPGAGEALDDRARDLATKAQGLASDLHRIAHELHPARLEHLGLASAVRLFVEELRDRQGLTVDVVETDWPREIPPEVALCLYRVIQEALQNVVRHSGVQEARVVLVGHRDRLIVSVSDDGVGFRPGSEREDRGLGLTGMRERLHLVGGTLDVDAIAGRGTRVRAEVPREAPSLATLDAQPGQEHVESSRPAR